jgi:threonine aldolase
VDPNESVQPLPRRQFASDNYAGICSEAIEAIVAANRGHAPAYGEDGWTRRACDLLRDVFEIDCEVFFTFNGTASNSLAVATLCKPYHGIICHEVAHLETDECGAPEFFSNGTKVLVVPGADGKIDLDAVDHLVRCRSDIHYPKPRALSVTEATEVGTVYSVDELQAVAELARRHELRVHMDGARFANALATLGVGPKELTWKVGIDVLCLGGTKNGLAVGEAVVFFDRELANEFDFRCKQGGQLASKTRFLAAPWIGMLEDGAWIRRAGQANERARSLESQLRAIPGFQIMFPCQANSVFVRVAPEICDRLHGRGWHFYNFIGFGGARLMCSWDTTPEDIAAFVQDARAAVCESEAR